MFYVRYLEIKEKKFLKKKNAIDFMRKQYKIVGFYEYNKKDTSFFNIPLFSNYFNK